MMPLWASRGAVNDTESRQPPYKCAVTNSCRLIRAFKILTRSCPISPAAILSSLTQLQPTSSEPHQASTILGPRPYVSSLLSVFLRYGPTPDLILLR